MYEIINDKVGVIAVFSQELKQTRPLKLRWQGREYLITEIGYYHKTKQKGDTIHVFSCTDGTSFFELCLNGDQLIWTLRRMWHEST